MGFISRKLLPACGNMCVCCPALNPSSRRPVKRYKKLLAEIFPKNLDGVTNERKIMKLCEYAAKNPLRIPKIAKYLEQRSYKELRSEHVNFVKIIMEAYSKLLYICKEQMAYFAISLLNVMTELVDNKQPDSMQILGCQTLTRFIYSQADNTYSRTIESLVHKVRLLACEHAARERRMLRASSLQCLSAIIWFMSKYSCVFMDIDEIIYVILDNYRTGEDIYGNGRSDIHHNWVDEVVRSETIGGVAIANDVSPSNTVTRRLETKDSSLLTREERESPEVWSQICIQKLADLANETTTMRRVLEPMFIYFDQGRHWSNRSGLALLVLSSISHAERSSGNEQLILAAIIRHLDNKNVVNNLHIKSDIVQVATSFVRQLRSRTVISEVGVVSDLCRHLRKSLQATVESATLQESNLNSSFQSYIEDCLLEIIRVVADKHLLFDMMAITLEKLSDNDIVSRATIGSLLILAHISSTTSVNNHSEVFPEALLVQLLKTMMHSDTETRTVAHQIFSVLLGRTLNHTRYESENILENKKWQSRTTSVFASATALLEKLRKEKEGLNVDRLGTGSQDEGKFNQMDDDMPKHCWPRKSSQHFSKLTSSVIDRIAKYINFTDKDSSAASLTEDQIAQLLYAFWLQAHRIDNKPSDYEAIAHSFSLTLLSSRLKIPNQINIVRAFQLLLSLRNTSLDPDSMLPPSCQRALFTLANGLLAFAGKIYHISSFNDLLVISEVDPYLKVNADLHIFVRSDLEEYGSGSDQEAAKITLSNLRNTMCDYDQRLLDILCHELSSLTGLEKDVLAKQLTETFMLEDVSLFGLNPAFDWVNLEAPAVSEESITFDEERSRTSSVEDDACSHSPVADISAVMTGMLAPVPSSNVISVGQLLESALHVAGEVAGTSVSTSPLPYGTMASQCEAFGMGTRKKLSSWLVGSHDIIPDDLSPKLHLSEQLRKVSTCIIEQSAVSSEPWLALRLPPASPFDNFMKAAGC